jgi:hypothetical protein
MLKPVDNLAVLAWRAAVVAAHKYLEANHLRADADALAECCKSWCKIKLPEAMADARKALECGMDMVAERTFIASMMLAGVEAAKEAGFPVKEALSS